MDFLEVYLTALAFVLFFGLVVLCGLEVGTLFDSGHYALGAALGAVVGIITFAPAIFALSGDDDV